MLSVTILGLFLTLAGSPAPVPAAAPVAGAPPAAAPRAGAPQSGAPSAAAPHAQAPSAAVPHAQAPATGAPHAAPEGVLDLDGHAADPLKNPAARATVLLFVRSDCPISNRYAPEIRRLRDLYAPKGVAFWMVYPDPDESAEAIRGHLREYAYGAPGLRDTRHALVRRTGASVTPEAALFLGSTMLYRGRIDDRWAELGKMRPEPGTRDLEDAIRDALAGRKASRRTRAIGCDIPELE